MVQAGVNATQAVAERMHAAQAFLERHGALHGGAHHVEARFPVTAIAGGALNVGPAAGQSVQRNAVSRWVEGGGHEGFHAVGNGVHTGGRRQMRGQTQRELRVANGRLGHQKPGVKTEFAVVVDDDDGATRHLTARAAGGGDGNDRRDTVSDAGRATFNGRVVRERSLMGGGNRHAFGAVNGRATAHRNQAVTALRFVDLGGSANGRLGRVGRRLVKHGHAHAWQRVQGFL